MSVSATHEAKLTVIETLETNVPAASAANARVTHSLFNSSHEMNASSTPPATKVAAYDKALVAGVGTIDLTALPGTNGATQDGTGLKVQSFFVKNPATNGNPITVTFGAANPYLLGGAAWKMILSPGMEMLFYGNDATPDVAAGAKNIDLAGTGAQALHVEIVLG